MSKQKTILNIYQLPEKKLVAQQDVAGWGLVKIMDFSADQFKEYNRLCCVARDDGSDNIDAHVRALHNTIYEGGAL